MSLGRYGADDPAGRRVPLNVSVDRWVSDALGKMTTKKSVSDMVNGLLATAVNQFDPGPSATLIYRLVEVLAEFEAKARGSGGCSDPRCHSAHTLGARAVYRSGSS